MAEETKYQPPQESPEPESETVDAAPESDGADNAAENLDQSSELGSEQAQIADLTERLLRLQAEFENYRRRMQREKEEVALYANQKLLLNFLPVLDNLERALSVLPTEGDEKLRQGVELTARSFRDTLAKEGVTPIEALGQPFDPNVHDAVMTEEDPEQPDGTVLVELLKGYRLNDRVIRASMVKVNKRD